MLFAGITNQKYEKLCKVIYLILQNLVLLQLFVFFVVDTSYKGSWSSHTSSQTQGKLFFLLIYFMINVKIY